MRLGLPARSRRRLVYFLVSASLALNVGLALAYVVQMRTLGDALDGLDRWTVLGRILLVTRQQADHESGALRDQLQACRVAQIKEYLATEPSAARAASAERETTRPRQPRDGRH